MRRFFVTLFVVSLIAAGGAYYWRTNFPEGTAFLAKRPPSGQMRGLTPGEKAAPSTLQRAPSERQDLAVTISIVSSLVSALAAVAQAWFTRRAMKA